MDRRQQKSRKAILDAFTNLLTKKEYVKITVQEIIDEADVGRTTFYAHFETKDALLEEMCTNLFSHVFSDHPVVESSHDFSLSEGDFKTVVCHILYHLKENGSTISRLLTGESSETFLRYFSQYLNKLIRNYVLSHMEKKNSSIPEDFLQNHIAGSFITMVQWWIKRGLKESPEELTEYFLAVTVPVI